VGLAWNLTGIGQHPVIDQTLLGLGSAGVPVCLALIGARRAGGRLVGFCLQAAADARGGAGGGALRLRPRPAALWLALLRALGAVG